MRDSADDYDGSEPWPDSLFDVMAAVQSTRNDDAEGLALVLQNADLDEVAVTAVKLIGRPSCSTRASTSTRWCWRWT